MSETLVSGYYGKEIARWKPLTIITKRSILDVAAALDPPLKRRSSSIKSVQTSR